MSTSHAKQKHRPATIENARDWKAKAGKPALLSLFLVALTLAAYVGVVGNGFVNYDDPDYVTSNPQVQKGVTLAGMAWAFRTGHASNWHPVTWLSHMLDWQLFGARPGPAHFVNVALHACNTVLLFLLLGEVTGLRWRSWFVAALFALHPLHVESVAWISERKDVLSALFFLLTLGAYARYARKTGSARWGPYTVSLAFFALGLMSKPMVVTLPFVLLLLDYWPLKRLAFGPKPRWEGTLPKLLLEKTPFFGLSLCASAVTFLVQREGGAVSGAYPFGARVANAVVSYVRYLFKTVWPVDLAVIYPHPGDWSVARVLAAVLVLAAISLVVLLVWRTKPYLLVGWLWFVGMLVPVSGLIQVGTQAMADRYTYLPLIGVFIAAVWLASDLASRRPQVLPVLAGCGTVILLCCGGLTARQLSFWRNSETLFQHALKVTPNSFVAYNNLGYYYGAQGRTEEELAYYRRALELNPEYLPAVNNLASALAARKRFFEAVPLFEKAVRQAPRNAEVHYNLGNALWELGQREEARRHYLTAVEIQPEHPEAQDKLGLALALDGQTDAAIARFESAISSRPSFAAAYSHLGNAYALQQRWNDAAREYAECLRLEPGNAAAHYNLGNVLLQLGRTGEAITHYREAVRLAPADPESAYKLGTALLRQGDREGALNSFRQALQLKPDYAEAARQLRTLQSP